MKIVLGILVGAGIVIAAACIYVFRDPDMRKMLKSDFDKGRNEAQKNTR